MITYQPIASTGSPNYTPINIDETSSLTPVIIHTSHATAIDELWLDAYNTSNTPELLYLIIGNTNNQNTIQVQIPPQRGIVPVLKGVRVSNGVQVKAYASTANKISIIANTINRITVS